MFVLRLQTPLSLKLLRHHLSASSSFSRYSYIRVVRFSTDKDVQSKTSKIIAQKPGAPKSTDLEKSYVEELFVPQEKEPKTTAEKVKRKVENTFLYLAIVGAFVVFGGICYFIYGEMFAPDSPQTIVKRSIQTIKDDSRCMDLFGPSLKFYGEETSRGRRRHYAHHRFEKDGQPRVRVMIHVKGDRNSGKAYAEVAYVDGGWQDRFLYVTTDGPVPSTYTIIDNRTS